MWASGTCHLSLAARQNPKTLNPPFFLEDAIEVYSLRCPADVGKRDLPPQLRSRFTELWVGEPSTRDELGAIAASYLSDAVPNPPTDDIVNFYLAAKAEAVSELEFTI